ncbi:MAG: M23 family metallopeptidase [Phycisphaerales bacterium]
MRLITPLNANQQLTRNALSLLRDQIRRISMNTFDTITTLSTAGKRGWSRSIFRVPQTVLLALFAVFTFTCFDARAERPLFQMPVMGGQTWDISTYVGHWNENALDMTKRGDDLENLSKGEPVLASAAGEVDFVDTVNGAHWVILKHGDGWKTHYVHLEELPPLTVGQKVAQGQQIGRTSNSGAYYPGNDYFDEHLHYHQEHNNQAVRCKFNGIFVDTYHGNPSSWGGYGQEGEEKVTSLNYTNNMFMGWKQGGNRYKLIYKPGTGLAKIVRINSNGQGTVTTWQGQWSLGWTHFIRFNASNGNPHAILYKSSDGTVTYLRLNNGGNGVTNLNWQTWGKGWTDFTSFKKNGDWYFLAYDSLYGYANVDRIHSSNAGITNVYQTSGWTKGRTSVVHYKLGNSHYVLLYSGGTGNAKISKITGSNSSIGFTTKWSNTMSKNWTTFVRMSHEGSHYLLAYKAHTGRRKIFKPKSNGNGLETKSDTYWALGWTAFSPFGIDANTKGHVLIYKAGTGLIKTVRLNSNASGTQTIWTGAWSKNWK